MKRRMLSWLLMITVVLSTVSPMYVQAEEMTETTEQTEQGEPIEQGEPTEQEAQQEQKETQEPVAPVRETQKKAVSKAGTRAAMEDADVKVVFDKLTITVGTHGYYDIWAGEYLYLPSELLKELSYHFYSGTEKTPFLEGKGSSVSYNGTNYEFSRDYNEEEENPELSLQLGENTVKVALQSKNKKLVSADLIVEVVKSDYDSMELVTKTIDTKQVVGSVLELEEGADAPEIVCKVKKGGTATEINSRQQSDLIILKESNWIVGKKNPFQVMYQGICMDATVEITGVQSERIENGYSYKVENSMATITWCDSKQSSTSMTIPEKLGGYVVGGIACLGAAEEVVEELTLPERMTSLEKVDLSRCEKLKKVVLGTGVTEIPDWKFENFANLEEVVLKNNKVTVGASAFSGATKLNTFSFEPLNGNIGEYAFSKTAFDKVDLSSSKVTELSYGAFKGCQNLSAIKLPEKIESVAAKTFAGTKLYDEKTDGPVYIDGKVFYKYNGKATGELQVADGTLVLADAVLTDQSAVTKVTLPDGVKTIGLAAFYECEKLEELNLPASVSKIGSMAFVGCRSLATLRIDAKNANFTSGPNGELLSKDGKTLIWCPVLSGASYTVPASVETIKDGALGCVGVKDIYVGNQVETIEPGAIGFDGVKKVDTKIHCVKDSAAHDYAEYYEIAYVTDLDACDHSFITYKSHTAATCTKNATEIAKCEHCDVEDVKEIPNTALGHKFVNKKCERSGCKAEISVDKGESNNTVTKEDVEKGEVKQVAVVKDKKTDAAVESVKKEAASMVETVVTDKDATEELVESGVLSEETVGKLKKAVDEGKEITTVIEVKEKIALTTEEKAVEEALKQKATQQYGENAQIQLLDVSVLLQTEDETIGEIHALNQPITITIAIPDDMKIPGAKYVIIRNHNGVVEPIETVVNDDGTISFTTDRFSIYGLTIVEERSDASTDDKENPDKDQQEEETDDKQNPDKDTQTGGSHSDTLKKNDSSKGEKKNDKTSAGVKTGDSAQAGIWIVCMMLAVFLIVGTMSVSKKTKE